MSIQSKKNHYKRYFWLVVLLLLARCLVLPLLPLSDPTEGRYALIAKEMVTSGDWVTPHLWHDGKLVPFLGKPPLYFWCSAACMKIFGINEFSARLPGVISLAITLMLMWQVLRRYTTVEIAWRAVLLCVSSVVIFVSSGIVIVDIMLTMGLSGALFAYFAFSMETDRSIRRRWSLLVFVMLALGFMTKGPVVLVLFGLPVLVWTAWFHRYRDIVDYTWHLGLTIFFVIVLPWFLLAENQNPGFMKYFFVHENFLRFVTHDYGDKYGGGHEHIRGAAIWMMFVAASPWSFYLLYKLIKLKKQIHFKMVFCNEQLAFFITVVIVNTLFWSFARQLLITYLFPMVPLFAAWLAILVSRYPILAPPKDTLFKRCSLVIGFVTIATIVIASPFTYHLTSTKSVIKKATDSPDAHGCSLYFVRHVPYSAYFYGNDKVIPHSKETVEASLKNIAQKSHLLGIAKKKYHKLLSSKHNPYEISFEKPCGKYELFLLNANAYGPESPK